ncbi:hypothetical protein ACUY3P_06515 [Corynebacterium lehmanniae]
MLMVLGVLQVVFSVGVSFWETSKQLQFSYPRTADIAEALRFVTALSCFGLAIIVSYNVAALASPRVGTANSLGRYPLKLQVLFLTLTPALITAVSISLGALPTFIDAVVKSAAGSVWIPLVVVVSTAFLFTVAALSALVALAFRKFHPVVSSLISIIVAYFVVAFGANSDKTWAVAPIVLQAVDPTDLTEPRNLVIALGISVCLALVAGGLLLLAAGASKNVSLSGVIAITAIVGVAGLLQAAAGPVAIVDRDSCAFSSGGSEICVDSADEPGLEQMTRDISTLEEYLPDGVRPRKLASISAYRIKSGDHGYQQFTTAGEDRRLDISGLLLDELGIGSCTDPTSEGAFVIDRIGVFITKRTGVYSKSVEKNGAFYQSISASGETDPAPKDVLSSLEHSAVDKNIAKNWRAIVSCQATWEMLTEES